MKIGVVCFPTYGGSGVVATEIGTALASKGHQIHFITNRRPARLSHFMENIYFHEVRTYDYPVFEYTPYESSLASTMVDVANYEELDLFHVHYAIPHASVAFMAKKILESKGKRIPVVTTLHGTDITLAGNDRTFSPIVEFSINNSDGVTCVSKFLRDKTKEKFEITRDIEVIYNFIDFKRFRKFNKDHFKKAIAPDGEKILIHTSNFRKVKRVQDVILTFKKIYEKVKAKLLLIGDGPERVNLEVLCRKLGLCEEIRFLGKQEAVEELLSVGDLFLPSGNESFGLAALEAMACEVPVISSNIGGLPEVVEHDKSGFLCNVGDTDAMAKYALDLLTNDDSLNKFKRAALARAKEFDIEKILPQYENYYKSTINKVQKEALIG